MYEMRILRGDAREPAFLKWTCGDPSLAVQWSGLPPDQSEASEALYASGGTTLWHGLGGFDGFDGGSDAPLLHQHWSPWQPYLLGSDGSPEELPSFAAESPRSPCALPWPWAGVGSGLEWQRPKWRPSAAAVPRGEAQRGPVHVPTPPPPQPVEGAPLVAGVCDGRAAALDAERCEELRRWLSEGGEQCARAIARLQGSVWHASCDPAGCWVVQDAITSAKPGDRASLVSELHGHVMEAVQSRHANFVIQRVVEAVETEQLAFIARECAGRAAEVARHRYGCRILCRLVEHANEYEGTRELLQEVLRDASTLCCHSFGHHVIQCILEFGEREQHRHIVQALQSDVLKMAQNRNASYIVEGTFKHCCEEDRRELIAALLQRADTIVSLAGNQFGSFVVRVLIHQSDDNARKVVLAYLRDNVDQLQTKHGKRLLDDFVGS